ncbi:DUF2142 domain-containing protein [Agrococcus lahaulensis]|uniref:DUF2142 domain-containing protein n=1 Tax=Agrococcus lahaulensis TaxID=341722 RepID=UPI000687A873|nr:DUF2142 domain-containing protein [Agrococcus lahaulensis]
MTGLGAGSDARPRLARLAAAILVPLAALAALLTWSVASPTGSSPDDDYHMASIWCAQGTQDGRCEMGDGDLRIVPDAVVSSSSCFMFDPTRAASCPVRDELMTATERGNWVDGAYPPAFYATMSALVGPDVQTSVLLMRATNAALYVGLLGALFALLPRTLRPLVLWSAAISIVPLGMFLLPSVNPSSWALISASGLWLATLGWFHQEGWRRWALAGLAAVLLAVGAGARSDASVYAVLGLAAASVLAFEPTRRYAVRLVLPLILSAAAVVAYFSTGLSGSIAGDASSNAGFLERTTLAFDNLRELPDLWNGVFGDFGLGGLGWLDTDMPAVTAVTASAVFAAVAFWGLRWGGVRKWLALAGVGAALVALPMYMLLLNDVRVGQWVQPRYVFPLIVLVGGLALFGAPGRAIGLARAQLVAVSVSLTLANSMGLHANLRRYVTGVDVPGFNLDRGIEWWWTAPVSPMTVWALGSLAFAVAAALLVALAWRAAAPRQQLGAPATAAAGAEASVEPRSTTPLDARHA